METGTTRSRLLVASFMAAGLTLLPPAICLIVFWLTRNPNEFVPSGGLVLFIWTCGMLGAYFRQVHYIRNMSQPLVPVTDQTLLRVRELAERMQVRCPAVRLLRTRSGAQQAMGYVAGWPSATVILSDGLLNRLTDDERDALICHELAHIANKTHWMQMVVVSGSACGGAVALNCGVMTWILIVPAVLIGVHRLLMRRVELD